jgi:Cu-processing system permease protein
MAILTITRLTFLEAARRRIALAALVLGMAFLILFGLGLYFIVNRTSLPAGGNPAENLIRSQVFNFISLMGLYAVNFLTIAMGALVTADTLAGEIASGTIQTIVTKPVRRAEVVLGKWLGYAGLLAMYLLLMVGGVVLIAFVVTGYRIPSAATGMALMYLESLVVMTLTLACSSAFSTLATGGIVFGLWGVAFVGGFVEQIGALFRNTSVVNIGIISSLLLPTEAVFRRAAYEMTSPVAQAMGMPSGPTLVVSVPSPIMMVYAVLYLGGMLALAIRHFGQRDL